MIIEETISKLKKVIISFDIDELDECIEILDDTENVVEDKDIIMDVLFSILENNPDEDFGTPGMIVHFLEKFYKKGYENKLLKSLERIPTSHTVWMLNRVINGSEGEVFTKYTKFMAQLLNRDDTNKELKSEISEFLNSK